MPRQYPPEFRQRAMRSVDTTRPAVGRTALASDLPYCPLVGSPSTLLSSRRPGADLAGDLRRVLKLLVVNIRPAVVTVWGTSCAITGCGRPLAAATVY